MLGIWILMFIFNLLIPLTMIGFGNYFYKHAPKEINDFFGYRTARSMRNRETWVFAHHYCGRLWRVLGWVLLGTSLIVMILVYGQSIDLISKTGGIITAVHTVALVLSIFPTEFALKRTFDDRGRRREA